MCIRDSSCDELACAFNAFGSFDPDGTITSLQWTYGDGTIGAGVTSNHTYAAVGTYAVKLKVTDNSGLSGEQTQDVLVRVSRSHVGDLDAVASTQGSTWTAQVTIAVHDTLHGAVAGAIVSGQWSSGGSAPAECTTSAAGRCTLTRSFAKSIRTVTLTANNVSGALLYMPSLNHDPDGDSNGTSISIVR